MSEHKTTIQLEFETDQPMQVDRVLFEALQRAVRHGTPDHDLEIISSILIAAMKSESERWDDDVRKTRDASETCTIDMAVKAALAKGVSDEDAKALGTIRTNKIMEAMEKV